MILVLAQQSAQAGSFLSTGLFLLGVLALMFILRKTLLKLMRSRRSAPRQARFAGSGRRPQDIIKGIDELNWVRRNNTAVRFSRTAVAFSSEEQAFLEQVEEYQQKHKGRRAND